MKTNLIPGILGGAMLLLNPAPVPAQPAGPAASAGLPEMKRSHRPPPRIRPQSQVIPTGGMARAGDPLPGVSDAEFEAFAEGMAEFNNTEDAAGGLGPVFNNTSCVACHSVPAIGGSSPLTVTRFGHRGTGGFDPLELPGGSLLQAMAIDPGAAEVVPPEANVISLRQSTPLFGLGLIEAIPDAAIIAGARLPKPDGVRGKVHYVQDVTTGRIRVGRFGWKAQQATLLAFSGDAYVNEMGITNRFFPTENAPNGDSGKLLQYDHVLDPEDTVDPATGRGDIDAAADFMRFLAPLPQRPAGVSGGAGKQLFQAIGCALCHTPVLQTGPNTSAALHLKPVPLYSDLLLHDMGALGDGITQGQADGRAMRTAPLWGMQASAPYLHDGRAATAEAAIRAHAGEAAVSKSRFEKLTPAQRQQLLDFLNSL
jgi:CxxC motif-containing protein (DUF1111 family)